MSETCLPQGHPVQGAGHGEGITPCPGHPAGIFTAVENVGMSPLQLDLPTRGLIGAGSPSPGDAQPYAWHCSWLRSLQVSARQGDKPGRECPLPLTSIMWCSDLSNRSMNSPRMFNRSISLREIMIRVRVLSSVPAPYKGKLEQISPEGLGLRDPPQHSPNWGSLLGNMLGLLPARQKSAVSPASPES